MGEGWTGYGDAHQMKALWESHSCLNSVVPVVFVAAAVVCGDAQDTAYACRRGQ